MALSIEEVDQAIAKATERNDTAALERLNGIRERLLNPGYVQSFVRGLDNPLEALGETAEALGAPRVGGALRWAIDTEQFQGPSASSMFVNDPSGDGTFGWSYLPQAAVEQVGQFAGSLVSRAAGAAAGGAIAGPPGAAVGGIAGPVAFEGLQVLGPTANQRALNDGRETPNLSDWLGAGGTAIASGALNAVAPNASGLIRRGVTEAITEGAQSAVQQAGETALTDAGLQIDPRQALGEAILGGASAGIVDGGLEAGRTVRQGTAQAADRLRYDSGFDSDDARTAEAIMQAADGDRNVIRNVSSTQSDESARGAANNALITRRAQLNDRLAVLRQLARQQDRAGELEDIISAVDTTANTEQPSSPLLDALGRINGLGGASRNITASTSEHQINRLVQAFPGVVEAQEAASLARQIKKLKPFVQANGDLGGIGQYTRHLDPFDGRNNAISRAIGMAASPITTGGNIVANRIARGLDKLTNRRSRVKRYVESVQRENPDIVPFEGSSASDLLEDIKIRKAAEKLDADAHKETVAALNRATDAELTRREKNAYTEQDWFNDLQQAREDDEKFFANADKIRETRDRARANRALLSLEGPPPPDADNLGALQEQAMAPAFEGDTLPEGAAFDPYRRWGEATGANPSAVLGVLQQLESEGIIPKGYAQAFRQGARKLWDGKRAKAETYAIQQIVRQRLAPEDRTYVAQKSPEGSEPKRLNATDGKPSPSRRTEKALAGARARRNLTDVIDRAKNALTADQYSDLLRLAETIDSPAITRDARDALVRQELARLFPDSPAIQQFWRKEFAPLAQIGNDYEIRREDTEAKKEKDFSEKIEKIAKVGKKKRKNKKRLEAPPAANLDEAPVADTQKGIETPPQTRVEKALSKLDQSKGQLEFDLDDLRTQPKTPADKALDAYNALDGDGAEQLEMDFSATAQASVTEDAKEADAPQEQPAGRGKTSLSTQFANRIHKIETQYRLAEEFGEELQARIESIDTTVAEGRIEAIILSGGTSQITQNGLTEAYAAAVGMSPKDAALEVDAALTAMEKAGSLRRLMKVGQGLVRVRDKVKTDDAGKALAVVHIEPLGTLKDYLEVAKAVAFAERGINQDQADVEYAPGQLNEGVQRAFKNYSGDKVDGTFEPILNILNGLRNQWLSVHPKMLTQIEDALSRSQVKKRGAIRDALTPKSQTGRTDDTPLRAVAQLVFTLGSKDVRKDTRFRQEAMAGDNGRIYLKNGVAGTQGGDIMKGLTRLGERAPVGSAAGLNSMFHSFGNLLGRDKGAPAFRRAAIFDDGVIENLIRFAEDPFGKDKLKRGADDLTAIGKLVEDSEGFFQALNVAHEVKDMVEFARARHKAKAQWAGNRLLMDPEVQADLAQNYKTDFIVQLDASNNAYQLLGLVTGYQKMLQATGMAPMDPNADPDTTDPADIYMGPALATIEAVPELAALDMPKSIIRKVFKNAIGTFLYEAESSTRKASISNMLMKHMKGAKVVSVTPGEGIITVPPGVVSNMLSEAGHSFQDVSYDDSGNVKKDTVTRNRVVKVGDKYVVEEATGSGKWKRSIKKHGSVEDAVEATYESKFLSQTNRELVRAINTQFPAIRDYLRFSRAVSEIIKGRGQKKTKIPSPDGIMLESSFKDDFEFDHIPVSVGGKNGPTVVNMGFPSEDSKIAGRGVAAFMMHQLDAYVLREVYRRMKDEGLLKQGFNPIHDSFGFHPSEAQRGQEIWAEVMQELGRGDYNIFQQVLEANGITEQEFLGAGGVVPKREAVRPLPQRQIPTALS